MELQFPILLGDDIALMALVQFHQTAPALAETGPTYDCGGEPASPAEYEIDEVRLFDTLDWHRKPDGSAACTLGQEWPMPEWMTQKLARHILDDHHDLLEKAAGQG